MPAESTVRVSFIGDASKLRNEMDALDGHTSKLSTGFGKIALAVGAAFAGAGVGSLIGAAEESQKVTKQTEAVIKSMGNAANVTAGQVAALSTSISKKTGIDDEAIQTGQNMLLTFGKIRNEVGEGRDIFDRSTKAMVDMSVAMGTDSSTAAMQLGKALQDPVAGLGALSRVGVKFTDEQKAIITTMVEAGDVAGAQGVILDELGRQFGGSAEAQATASAKLRTSFGNLQEEIGAKLIPVFERLVSWLFTVSSFLNEHREIVIGALAGIAVGLAAYAVSIAPVIAAHVTLAAATIAAYLPFIAAGVAIAAVVAGLIYAYQHFETFREVVDTAFRVASQAVTIAMEVIRTVIETVLGAIEAFWLAWGETIMGFVQRTWETIRTVIEGAMTVIRGVINVIMGLIHGDFSQVWEGIRQIFAGVWLMINGMVDQAVNVLRTTIEVGMRLIHDAFVFFWDAIVRVLDAAWQAIVGLVQLRIDAVRAVVEAVMRAIHDAFVFFWGAIVRVIEATWQTIVGIVDGYMNAVRSVVEAVMRAIHDAFVFFWDAIVAAGVWFMTTLRGIFEGGLDLVVDVVARFPGRIIGFFTHAWDTIKQLASDAAEWVLSQIGRMLGPLDNIAGKIGGILGKAGGIIGKAGGIIGEAGGIIGDINPFHTGGVVGVDTPRTERRGLRNDEMVAVLQRGETVLTRGQQGLLRDMLRTRSGGGGQSITVNLNGAQIGSNVDATQVGWMIGREISAALRGAA